MLDLLLINYSNTLQQRINEWKSVITIHHIISGVVLSLAIIIAFIMLIIELLAKLQNRPKLKCTCHRIFKIFMIYEFAVGILALCVGIFGLFNLMTSSTANYHNHKMLYNYNIEKEFHKLGTPGTPSRCSIYVEKKALHSSYKIGMLKNDYSFDKCNVKKQSGKLMKNKHLYYVYQQKKHFVQQHKYNHKIELKYFDWLSKHRDLMNLHQAHHLHRYDKINYKKDKNTARFWIRNKPHWINYISY